MKRILCAMALAFSVGCATASFRPYVGQQQSWPTAMGSIVNTHYDLPIFTSLPPAPYDLLGELRVSSPFYAQPEEGHMPVMVKKAIEVGADAVVFVDGAEFFRASYGDRSGETDASGAGAKPTFTQVNRFLPESFRPGVTFLAVKWLKGPPPGLEAAPVVIPPVVEQKPITSATKVESVAPPAQEKPAPSPEKQPALPPLKQPSPKVEEKPVLPSKVEPTTNFGPHRSAAP